jgi:hypothetical protein
LSRIRKIALPKLHRSEPRNFTNRQRKLCWKNYCTDRGCRWLVEFWYSRSGVYMFYFGCILA